MAKTQNTRGQYRQLLLAQQGHQMTEPEEPVSFFRIRFYICLCLFLCYVILDYTKASFYEVDSARIYAEVRKDLAADMDLEETLAHMLDGIWVSENAQEDTGGLYTEP
ncbi:MAG: hypothetical protein HFI26_10775 [Lachnospiraceae bacterium]|jgi:hypothetical protein|nr:hypothetical protein [Lachnospiraceae bacterium]